MTESLRFGDIEIRLGERQLLVDGERVNLGARAFDVLLAPVERRGRIVPKNELLDTVWPSVVVGENNLQVHISSLRKSLGPWAIATIPGRGYRFTAAPSDAALVPPQAAMPGPTPSRKATDLPVPPLGWR